MKSLETMTSDERNLLLYFETCAVDYGGKIDNRRMNREDIYMAEEWDKEGFVKFGRIKFRSIIKNISPLKRARRNTHWCELSDEAWDLAHKERRVRCKRIMSQQTIDKTCDR